MQAVLIICRGTRNKAEKIISACFRGYFRLFYVEYTLYNDVQFFYCIQASILLNASQIIVYAMNFKTWTRPIAHEQMTDDKH